MTEKIQCSCCGEELPAEQMELTFNLPEPIFNLPTSERESRAIGDPDSYVLDASRFFVRGLIPLSVDKQREYCLGAWAEVSKRDYELIQRIWNDEQIEQLPLIKGVLSSAIPYTRTNGEVHLEVQLQGSGSRPMFQIASTDCTLYQEQLNGICALRAYEYTSFVQKDRFVLCEEEQVSSSACPCCDGEINTFCGYIENQLEHIEADYWLRIPTGHPDRFTVAIAIEKNNFPRVAVLYCENREDGLTYWIQNAEDSPWRDFGEFGQVMDREEVLNDQYKAFFFDIVDEISASDSRLKAHLGRSVC